MPATDESRRNVASERHPWKETHVNQSELKVEIGVSREQVWEVLFRQYGDIHVHNPTMVSSRYMADASIGELHSARHVKFNDKLYLEEEISEVDELESFTVVATDHNLPFLTEMSATYELSSISDDVTRVTMTSRNATSPGFMIYLMRGRLRKSLAKHLFGLKYYLETGQTVGGENYSRIFKSYS